jgi:hypothetical protein
MGILRDWDGKVGNGTRGKPEQGEKPRAPLRFNNRHTTLSQFSFHRDVACITTRDVIFVRFWDHARKLQSTQ